MLIGVGDIIKRLEVIRQKAQEGTHGMIVGPSLVQAMDAAIVCMQELERLQRPRPKVPHWYRREREQTVTLRVTGPEARPPTPEELLAAAQAIARLDPPPEGIELTPEQKRYVMDNVRVVSTDGLAGSIFGLLLRDQEQGDDTPPSAA